MPAPPLNLADVLFPGRDVSFARLVTALSEPATGPHADNLVSNEDSYPRVVGELERRAVKDGIYLGVGPDQNFTLLAPVRPRLAFIVDYRRRNLLLHLLHKALFTLSDDRASYLARLTARQPGSLARDPSASEIVAAFAKQPLDHDLLKRTIVEVADIVRPWKLVRDEEWAELATIQSRLAGPGTNARFLALPMYPTFGRLIQTPDRDGKPAHLLAREASYQAVRQLQRGDRILPLTGDLASATALPRLGDWLRNRRLSVAVMYVSDVEFFLLRAGRFTTYVENLAAMPWAEGALLVRSSTREIHPAERVRGDSSTTIARLVDTFLIDARAGRVRTADDLFDQ